MKTTLISILSVLSLALVPAEPAQVINWKLLAKVEFVDKYFEEYEAWYLVPKFSDEVKALDGKSVVIKGYVIPLDVDGGQYALSAYPFSACFFCGGAGPESVMSLHFKDSPDRFDTDDFLNFTGTLRLNSEDVEDFNYILEDCKVLK